ncbi:MAG: LL-diaminopimelate aminotransferase [Clostridia bacterium]|nr:LL-diaminopimelate aminotransferase [Clostridia bacterium]
MIKINENFLNMSENYLFTEIAKRTKDYKTSHPKANIIKLGIGDVTLPLGSCIIEAMHKAVDELADKNTFKGYGPEIGYSFLREKIIEWDYKKIGIEFDKNEVFISDGIATDIGNFGDLLSIDNNVGIANPVYPEYLDVSQMAGRTNITYIPFSAENNFSPSLPEQKIDLIYLCMPNNPTGTALTKDELKRWVDYAIDNKSLILFDAAYEQFIEDKNIPHSIYEIEGAKKVAIEFKSYSKTAGFTGVRCGYTVVPKEVIAYDLNGDEIELNSLWNRRQCTKFNGASYVSQKAAEAIYTEEGQRQIYENIKYYKRNCKIIREGLLEAGYDTYGGINSPYIWFKVPEGYTSWKYFDLLLDKVNVVTTPGSGFGSVGEGYLRLSSFGSYENTIEAINRIKKFNNYVTLYI